MDNQPVGRVQRSRPPKGARKARRRTKAKNYPIIDENRSEDLRQDMRKHGLRVAEGGFKQGKRY